MADEVLKTTLAAFQGYIIKTSQDQTHSQHYHQLRLEHPVTGISVSVKIQVPGSPAPFLAPERSFSYNTPPRPARPRRARRPLVSDFLDLEPLDSLVPFNDDDFKVQDGGGGGGGGGGNEAEDLFNNLNGNYWQTPTKRKRAQIPVDEDLVMVDETTTTTTVEASGAVTEPPPKKKKKKKNKIRVVNETNASCPLCLGKLRLDLEKGRKSVTYFPCCRGAIHDDCLRKLKQFYKGKTEPNCIMCREPLTPELIAAIHSIFVDLTASGGETKEERRGRYVDDTRNRRIPTSQGKRRKRTPRPFRCKLEHSLKNGRTGWKTFMSWDKLMRHMEVEHETTYLHNITRTDTLTTGTCIWEADDPLRGPEWPICGKKLEWGSSATPELHPLRHLHTEHGLTLLGNSKWRGFF